MFGGKKEKKIHIVGSSNSNLQKNWTRIISGDTTHVGGLIVATNHALRCGASVLRYIYIPSYVIMNTYISAYVMTFFFRYF